MLDLIIKNSRLRRHKELMDIAISDGKIVEISPQIDGEATETINADGNLVCPPFVDPHFHMDSTLSMGLPRFNKSGTLLEGIQIWDELKPDLTAEKIKERAKKLIRWSVARGTLCIRSHVDVTDPTLLATQVLLEVREEVKDIIDLQLVAFPQNGVFRPKGAKELLTKALDMGVDVVGGIPHFERTMAAGAESVTWLCEQAADRGLRVDMHCDETDDPMSRHIETLAYETTRLGLGSLVSASHLTSMHSMDNYYVSKLLPLIAESGLGVICNPIINIHIQGRHDNYPKRRGLTRVPELLENGINVAFGQDTVMDPWYAMGSHDMLEVAHMGAHCLHMVGLDDLEKCFTMVTDNGAKVMGIEDYGIEVGKSASMVILRAKSPVDALRLRAERLFVIKNGNIIAKTSPSKTTLCLSNDKNEVDFCL